MLIRSFTLSILAIASASALLSSARAAGPLLDGGFEAATSVNGPGSLGDGWSATTGEILVFTTGNSYNVPIHGGDRAVDLDDGLALNTLSQTFATTPGATYTISYWLTGDVPVNVTSTFGSHTLYSGPAPSTGDYLVFTPYQFYSFTAAATGISTTLSFSSAFTYSGSGVGTVLDDASVTLVPEPTSLAAIAATGLLLRRRR